MKNLQFLLLFLFPFLIFSQDKITISGDVLDEESGESIIQATILVPELNLQANSNTYGFFSLILPKMETYNIIVEKEGYESYEETITAQEDIELEIVLTKESDENDFELDEVVIESNKDRVPLSSPQMSLNKLEPDVIKKTPVVFGESDLLKTIQLLPGVTNSGEGTGGFNVRGGAADQNLVLLDEATIYNTSHLFGFFSVFNSDVIKNVNLYKGGIPAKYGGRVSSVLDIHQREGNNKEYHGEGGVSVISARALFEGPIQKNKGSFLVAGRGSYAHLFFDASEELQDNTAYFYDLNLKASYELNEKNKLYLSGYFGNDVVEFQNAFNNSYGNASFNLRWNRKFSSRFFSNLSAIYTQYDYNLTLGFIDLDWRSDIQDFNIKYDLEWRASQKIKTHFGLNSNYYVFNPGEVRPSTETSAINPRDLAKKYAWESALYFDVDHKLTNNLTLRYGLRWSYFARLGGETLRNYENNQPVLYNEALGIYTPADSISSTEFGNFDVIESFNNLEPRLALSYSMNRKNAIKASYNRTAQYIHLLSNTNAVSPLDVWTPSGEYIEPQIADQFAVGYFRNFGSNDYSLDTEVFYKRVDNRIDYIDGADLIAQEAIETQILNGEARAFGLEILFKKNKGKFTGWLAYTLSRSEQRTNNPPVGGPGINSGEWYKTNWDRTHDISLVGNYQLNPKWEFNMNFVFQTGRPATFPNGRYIFNDIFVPNYGLRNENRLPDYHRIDVSAIYTPRPNKNTGWRGEWVFSIYNLYNRMNAAAINFEAEQAVQTSIFGIVPSVGYNFKF